MTDTYTFHCRWSEEDKAFVGTFDGMPSLSWVARTKDAALRGIVTIVIEAEEDIKAQEEAQ
jgi:hypothetical protein